jgi:hypothetical protein
MYIVRFILTNQEMRRTGKMSKLEQKKTETIENLKRRFKEVMSCEKCALPTCPVVWTTTEHAKNSYTRYIRFYAIDPDTGRPIHLCHEVATILDCKNTDRGVKCQCDSDELINLLEQKMYGERYIKHYNLEM